MSRLRNVLPAAVAVAVALGGCGAPASTAPTRLMSSDGYVEEYAATVAALSWPAGERPGAQSC